MKKQSMCLLWVTVLSQLQQYPKVAISAHKLNPGEFRLTVETRRNLDHSSLDGISQVEYKVADGGVSCLLEIHCIGCLLSLLLYLSGFLSNEYVSNFILCLPNFLRTFHSLASSHRCFFCLLKLHLSHPKKEPTKHWMSFPFHTDKSVCIFPLSRIYFLDNFSSCFILSLNPYRICYL